MYKAHAMKILSRISIKRIEISMNTLLIVHGKGLLAFWEFMSVQALHARLSAHVIDSDQYEESVKGRRAPIVYKRSNSQRQGRWLVRVYRAQSITKDKRIDVSTT